MKNIMLFIAGIISLYLAWITGTGEILKYISFADVLNEIGFFICLVILGSLLIFSSFSKA